LKSEGLGMETDDIIERYLEQGILISPDYKDELKELKLPPEEKREETVVLNKSFGQNVQLIQNTAEQAKERTVRDFVSYFNVRFKTAEHLLRQRQEVRNATAIRRITMKKERTQAAFIGMVVEKRITKNNNILFTLEDSTGTITTLVTTNKGAAYDIAKDTGVDEVIGVAGTYDEIVYADKIVYPDIPLSKELKKSPVEEYVVIAGDLHIGSELFLEKEFKKFIYWLQGKIGNDEQKAQAKKVKYVIFTGDLVEGVGIYPRQEKDLAILDIYDQYKKFIEYIKQIPSNINIILSPGNHDAVRLSEPQPPITKQFLQEAYDMSNVYMVSNPALVNLGATKTFPGFDILIYHGASLIYYAENVPSIRDVGGMKRADLVMKHLLQRRHLAPAHLSTLYVPNTKEDPLAITRIPDLFVTGHIHRATVANYRNVLLINSSGWVGNTEYQDKRGIEPTPGRIIVYNTKTGASKTMNFMSKGS